MKEFICIIPARGGSKRLPRKNVLPLAGKPLLAHTIDAALEAGVFDDVVVSSDDEEILNISEARGALADVRPAALANDTARVVEVVAEFLERAGVEETHRHVAVLLPTCPLRSVDDVRRGVARYAEQPEDCSLVAVVAYDFPPQLAMELSEEDHALVMHRPETYRQTTRSQSLGQAFHPNGALYVTSVPRFLRERTFFAEPMIGFEMPAERSVDIDYPYQFHMAAFMAEHFVNEQPFVL